MLAEFDHCVRCAVTRVQTTEEGPLVRWGGGGGRLEMYHNETHASTHPSGLI